MIDSVEVLRATEHRTGHIGDFLHNQPLSLVLKTKQNTIKANTHLLQSQTDLLQSYSRQSSVQLM